MRCCQFQRREHSDLGMLDQDEAAGYAKAHDVR